MTSENTVFVNFYCESEATIELENGNKVFIQQKTTYPESDKITLIINPEKETEFSLALRIPGWSAQNSIKVNGEEIPEIQMKADWVLSSKPACQPERHCSGGNDEVGQVQSEGFKLRVLS